MRQSKNNQARNCVRFERLAGILKDRKSLTKSLLKDHAEDLKREEAKFKKHSHRK